MDYVSAILDPEDAEKARVKRLKKLSDAVIRARVTLAKTMTRIGDFVEEIRSDIPAEHLKSFLQNDCKIPRAEAATFMKLTAMIGPHLDVIHSNGVGFPALKALVAADDNVRTEILTTIAAGTSIDSADVRAAQRRQKLEREDSSAASIRQRKTVLSRLARVRSKTVAAQFEACINGLAQQMEIYFADETSDQKVLEAQRTDMKSRAMTCLAQFEAIHDISGLLPEWELGLYNEDDVAVRLTRAHLALKAFAEGRFGEYDDDGRPYDMDNAIDLRFFNAIAWLSGHAVKPMTRDVRVVHAQPRSTVHTIAPHPLVSLEICAGAGGEALGLHAAGFHAKAIYEKNESAVATLRQHPFSLKDRVHEADICNIDFTPYRGRIDLVAGGVPCQGHSTSGERKGKNDERDLFLEAVRIVDEIRPRAFFFENVKGFCDSTNIDYRAELHQKFEEMGYSNRVFKLIASDYGLPQSRLRVAFIGFRDGGMSRFRMPPKFPQWHPSVVDAIGDLVAANGWKGYKEWASNIPQICPTLVGGSEKSGRLSFCEKRRKETWEQLGIDFSYLQDEAPGPDHEGLFRMTLKMGQRLQGFPDAWQFQGSRMKVKCQIGNAFPPIMAKAVGLAIYSALEGVEFDYEAALKIPFEIPTVEKLHQKRTVGNLNQPDFAMRLEDELRFFGEPTEDDNER